MSTFFAVLGVILIVLLALAVMMWPVYYCIEGKPTRRGVIWRVTAALLLLAFIITVGLKASPSGDDNARHCGPGTEYRSQYNVATKTTSWWCEA